MRGLKSVLLTPVCHVRPCHAVDEKNNPHEQLQVTRVSCCALRMTFDGLTVMTSDDLSDVTRCPPFYTRYQICHFWSMRSALLLLEKSVDIQDDGFEYSSELRFDLTPQRIAQSTLLSSVAAADVERWQSVHATRHVRSFERGSLEVRSNDWVVVTRNGQSCIGRVGEMVEFVAHGGRFTRMLLHDARPVQSFDAMSGGILRVSTSVAAVEHVVPVESSSFHELYCDGAEHDGELRYTYIY